MRNRSRLRWMMAAAFGALMLHSTLAGAEEKPKPKPIHWDPAWTHANAWDYSLTGVGLATLVTETLVLQNHMPTPRWFGPILFDQAVLDATRGSTEKIRNDAANVSWGLWFLEMGYPFVVDVPYAWARYGRQVAWDVFWQAATAFSLSGAFDFAARDIVGRVRPLNYACLQAGGSQSDCIYKPEDPRSFPSGHFTETTTATALICTQHLKMQLYGPPWDAVTCASAIVTDGVVGALRLVADDHYATDLIAAGAFGVLFGWGVPTLMHLHGHSSAPTDADRPLPPMIIPMPMAFDHGAGLGATGFF